MKTNLPFSSYLFVAILCCIFSLPNTLYAQLENTNWHFGQGVSVEITANGPQLGTSAIDANGNICPSSISDSNGETMLYTDGANVYNASGTVVANGEFNQSASENVFVPYPENDQLFYLFRSNGSGIDYSVIDVGLGDEGTILEDQKEINIYGVQSQLVCGTISDGSGFWLISADNNGGASDDIHLNAFKVDLDGVNLFSDITEYFFFAGWNNALDDARLSPDCSKIAISYKGHLMCFMKFDNETGEFYDIIYDDIDTGASFANITELEFSGNSSNLYALGDYNTIKQYSLDVWTTDGISASAVVVEEGLFGNNQWTDLKLAPDGKIYLMNTLDGQLDVINSPNTSGVDCDLETGILPIPEGLTTYFPNLPNITCAPPFLDLSIDHQYECLGDETELWYNWPFAPDSVLWNFGDPITGDLNTSTLDFPIHIYSDIGDYEVTFFYYLDGYVLEYSHDISIYAIPDPDLGPDQVFCEGDTIVLSGGTEDYAYAWNDNQSTASIDVVLGGEYIVNVDNNGCLGADSVNIEMIPYAQLELGPDLIVCDEISTTVLADTLNLIDFEWYNGSADTELSVTSDGTYWATGENSCFTVSDSLTVSFLTSPVPDLGPDQEFCEGDTLVLDAGPDDLEYTWNTDENTPTIDVLEGGEYIVVADNGCIGTDSIVLTMIEIPFLSVGGDMILCDQTSATAELETYNSDSYQWSNGSTSEQITFTESGWYWATAENNCATVYDSLQVLFVTVPVGFLPNDMTACEGDTIPLQLDYPWWDINWSPGGSGSSIEITESGEYTATMTIGSCVAEDIIEVIFSPTIALNEIVMPNIFSPNGDVVNPVFKPFVPSRPEVDVCDFQNLEVSMQVYSRWGNLLAEDVCQWNGLLENKDIEEGVYYYIVDLKSTCFGKEDEDQKYGHISLVRGE